MERSRPCLHEKAILQTQNESPSGRRKIIRLCIYPAGRDSTFGGIPKEGRCPKYHRTDSYHRLLGWLGHRQISPSLSYPHDMTFLACGACVTLSIIAMCRPARSASSALVVPSVTTLRMATHLRPFPEILSWTQKAMTSLSPPISVFFRWIVSTALYFTSCPCKVYTFSPRRMRI